MDALNIIAGIITLLSLIFAIYQWKKTIRIEEIYSQNMRKLWNLSRAFTPYRRNIMKLREKVKDKEIITYFEKSYLGFVTIIRDITPLYFQSIKENLDYRLVKCMIANGEITSEWELQLVMREIKPALQNSTEAESCYKYLEETRILITDVHNQIIENEKKFKFNSSDSSSMNSTKM